MHKPDAPLTEAEFERLEAFLESCGPEAMNLEMLDGFFAALICGPEPVPPSEYLPEVWGEPAFRDLDEAAAMTDLVMRHWNTIAAALLRTLAHDDIYEAYVYEDEQGQMLGNDWAHGFMHGVQMRADSWQPLLQDTEEDEEDPYGDLLFPMLWLVHEHDDDPELRPPPLAPDKRDDILASMIGNLTLIYRRFAAERQQAAKAPDPVRRASPKVGRNAPCPCGSGRKFKHCCGRGNEPVH